MATATQTTRQQRTQTTETVEQAPDSPLLDKMIDEASRKLDALASRYNKELAEPGMGALRRAMLLGQAMSRLEEALTPELMKRIKALENSPLGFLTDEKAGYAENVIKKCTIQGLLEGVFPFGNEWNIIKGKCYITKAGYKRKVEELENLTDLDIVPGLPRQDNGTWAVRVAASWKKDGIKQQLLGTDGKPGRVFAVTSQAGATADNLIGKAERKAYKAIWVKATGSTITAPDGEVDDAPDPTPALAPGEVKPDAIAERRLADERQDTITRLGEEIREADTAAACDRANARIIEAEDFIGHPAAMSLRTALAGQRTSLGLNESGGES